MAGSQRAGCSRCAQARDRLAAAGDPGSTAKAEMLAGFRFWNEAPDRRGGRTRSARARDLVEHAPGRRPSWGACSAGSRSSRCCGSGSRRPSSCASGCWRSRAPSSSRSSAGHALNTRGVARIDQRRLGGLSDLEQSVEFAERLNAADAHDPRLQEPGQHARRRSAGWRDATALHRRGLEAARRFGADYQIAWFDTELGVDAFARRRLGRRPAGVRPARPLDRPDRSALHGGGRRTAAARSCSGAGPRRRRARRRRERGGLRAPIRRAAGAL